MGANTYHLTGCGPDPLLEAPNPSPNDKICSDYDEDCSDVPCHIRCWLGGQTIGPDGTIYVTALADGYCPFLRPNPQ